MVTQYTDHVSTTYDKNHFKMRLNIEQSIRNYMALKKYKFKNKLQKIKKEKKSISNLRFLCSK